MLGRAAAATPPADVAIDLAIAGAQVLDEAGRHDEAIAAARQALAGAPAGVDAYWQAAGLLVRNDRTSEAVGLFDAATDAEMMLMKAVLLELAGQSADAGKLLNDVQDRRPEWFALWVARAMLLAAHQQSSEARQRTGDRDRARRAQHRSSRPAGAVPGRPAARVVGVIESLHDCDAKNFPRRRRRTGGRQCRRGLPGAPSGWAARFSRRATTRAELAREHRRLGLQRGLLPRLQGGGRRRAIGRLSRPSPRRTW